MTIRLRMISAALLGVTCVVADGAHAVTLQPGIYDLSNHPDGNAANPLYGLRLDELVDVTPGHDIFSFDFDAAQSSMFMEISVTQAGAGIAPGATTIRIFGQSLGGRDIGSTYANDAYLGVYEIDFTYAVGVSDAPGDDDLWVVAASGSNSGQITPPGQTDPVPLADKSNGSFTFRLGDLANGAGHRGFPGISGWGWLTHNDPDVYVKASDWLFTATWRQLPGPGTALPLLVVAGCAMRRRRAG